MRIIRKVFALLTERERRQAYCLIPLVILMAIMEVIGIASLSPFLMLLTDPQTVHTNGLLAWAYNTLAFESTHSFLLATGIGVLLVIILSNGVLAAGNWVLAHFASMRNHSISRRLLVSYLRQPYTFFLERNSAGLANNILQEVLQVVNGIVLPGLQAIAKGVAALGILVMLIVLDPLLALLAGFLLGGSYALIFGTTRRYLGRIGRGRVIANQARHKAANEAIGGIKQLKLSGREAEMIKLFSAPSLRFAQYQTGSRVISTVPRYLLEGLAFASIVGMVVVLLAMGQVVEQMIPILGVYAFAGYRLLPALQQVFNGLTQTRYSLGALDEVHEIVQQIDGGRIPTPSAAEFPAHDETAGLPFTSALVLNELNFRYPGSHRNTLIDINLEIPAKSSVAFVGETGSGKTTTIDVILGLLTPTSGTMTVDGTTVDASNLPSWQQLIGYVPQDVYLNDDTITRNIAFGLPDEKINMDAVRTAARLAQLDHFIEQQLAQGYETVVGERGVRLSGGQQQRLGIARALYGDPEVLVLDEATSALDNATEREVFEGITALSGDKTIIMIAHRLSTIRHSDRIFVLNEGKLDSQGTYEELLEYSDTFRRIAASTNDGLGRVEGVRLVS